MWHTGGTVNVLCNVDDFFDWFDHEYGVLKQGYGGGFKVLCRNLGKS